MADICSIWAYNDIVDSGKVGKLQAMYLSIFSECNTPLTVNQFIIKYKEVFGERPYKTHHGMGSRISELCDMGFLNMFDKVKCEFTGKTVNRWIYSGRTEPFDSEMITQICSSCFGSGHVTKKTYKRTKGEQNG
jgi:hypothetical protein